ncbi:MAG: hypothetical protein ACRCTE_14200 [Cellulosilyticaceae bacterium]
MSPLAKEVIEKLSHEEDVELLAEVLDFYEYVKQKKVKKMWEKIEEVEPTDEEVEICNQYQSKEQELMDFNSLVQELGLDE